MSYDTRCQDLAGVFLEDTETPVDQADIENLAQTIQDAIEDWLRQHEQILVDTAEQ